MPHWNKVVRLLWYRLLLGKGQLPKKVISREGTLLAAEERSNREFIQRLVVRRTWFPAFLLFCHFSVLAFSHRLAALVVQEACYCSCRHNSNTSEKDKDRSLSWELSKNERNILKSPCRLPLIFHWPELGYVPIPEPPHREENAVTRGGLLLNSSKFFLLGETSGWGVGSIQVPPRHMASWCLNKGKVSFAR